MNIAVFLGKESFADNPSLCRMLDVLASAGHNCSVFNRGGCMPEHAEMLLSVGGDGTFLASASLAAPSGIPVLGVNLGHLGFLSENSPEAVAGALVSGNWSVEERALLTASSGGCSQIALNDVVVRRSGYAMLGVKVTVDGKCLPVCWSDGLIISTPSGSTAYSLSVGGPIVMPHCKVLIIAPIAPHNLNTRPLIVPQESRIEVEFLSRDAEVELSADNKFSKIPSNSVLCVEVAQFSLKRVCLASSSFIRALSEKLFLGEDKRNEK